MTAWLLAAVVVVSSTERVSQNSVNVWRPINTNTVHVILVYGHSYVAGLEDTTVNPTNGQNPPAAYSNATAGVWFWKGGSNAATTNTLLNSVRTLGRNGFELVFAPAMLSHWGASNSMVVASGFPGASSAQLRSGTANWNTLASDVSSAAMAVNSPVVYEGALIWALENNRGSSSAANASSNDLANICSQLTASYGITNFSIGLINTNVSGSAVAICYTQTLNFVAATSGAKTNDANPYPLFTDSVHLTWQGMGGVGTNAAVHFGILPLP